MATAKTEQEWGGTRRQASKSPTQTGRHHLRRTGRTPQTVRVRRNQSEHCKQVGTRYSSSFIFSRVPYGDWMQHRPVGRYLVPLRFEYDSRTTHLLAPLDLASRRLAHPRTCGDPLVKGCLQASLIGHEIFDHIINQYIV